MINNIIPYLLYCKLLLYPCNFISLSPSVVVTSIYSDKGNGGIVKITHPHMYNHLTKPFFSLLNHVLPSQGCYYIYIHVYFYLALYMYYGLTMYSNDSIHTMCVCVRACYSSLLKHQYYSKYHCIVHIILCRFNF